MARPLRFINVCGFSKIVPQPGIFARWLCHLGTDWNVAPEAAARRSKTMNPTLWRVSWYCRPGLPRPMISWKDMGWMSDQKTKRNEDSMDAKWNFADLRFLKSKKRSGRVSRPSVVEKNLTLLTLREPLRLLPRPLRLAYQGVRRRLPPREWRGRRRGR